LRQALLAGRRQLSVTRPGVYAPESCVDPGVFIELLRAKSVAGLADAGMTIPLK
jgi:hypothetical protein